MVPSPRVHLLSKHARMPYMGTVSTRPFYRGRDAADAVTVLGLLPSVATATHLVAAWDYEDLNVALQCTGSECPTGLVVLEASLDVHTVRWNPYIQHVGTNRGDGLATVLPEWDRPVHHPDGWLPGPIISLLALWREWRAGDIDETRAELAAAGFSIFWADDAQIPCGP